MTKTKPLSPFLIQCQARINQCLQDLFNEIATPSAQLKAAMQYSTLAGGKRLRALLIYATGQAFNITLEKLDHCAIAVELIHTYSLIHDDLPAMDNDDLRRGKPTCHKAFNEATAILAGDALQTLAFTQLSKPHRQLAPEQQLKMIQILSTASGLQGMCGGQMLDIESLEQTINLEHLQQIHQLKTGALISACIEMALSASQQITTTQIYHMQQFAKTIGLAFQIQDDLLDVTSDAATLGKNTQRDESRNKPNYPALMGIEACEQLLQQLMNDAHLHLKQSGAQGDYLQELAQVIIARKE